MNAIDLGDTRCKIAPNLARPPLTRERHGMRDHSASRGVELILDNSVPETGTQLATFRTPVAERTPVHWHCG